MSWLFSRALVAEYSAANCLDGELSAQLNVMPTPHKFWRNDKTMESSELSRFGLMCAVLTEDRGAELLKWFLAASRVRTLAQPAKALAWPVNDPGSGARWRESLARFSPDSSMWKTAQFSLLGGSELFLGTWPRWGSMLDGESYQLRTPALRTSEKEFGLWQTPVADDAVNRKQGKWNSRGEPKLSAQVMHPEYWPTPVASDTGSRSKPYAQGGTPLSLAAKLWPTPTTMKSTGGPALCKWGGQARARRWRRWLRRQK